MKYQKLSELKAIAATASGTTRVMWSPDDALKLIETIERLAHIGGMMSNLCANISQTSWPAITDHDRDTMGRLYREWDAVWQ